MTRHEEMFDEISGERMAELLERTVQRGTLLRRRNLAIRASLVALIICAAAVPLSLSLSHQQAPASTTAIEKTSGAAFQDVAWKHVHYPGLNFSKVQFPGNIGCNPGSEYGFTVEVQRLSFIRSAQGIPIALVLVRCDAGTPAPSSFYAFTVKPGSSNPRLLQTLLAPFEPTAPVEWFATTFSISKDAVILPARGVTGSAALCCPNVTEDMRWVLRGEHFVRVNEPEHNAVAPTSSPSTPTSVPGAALGSGEPQCLATNLRLAEGPFVSPQTGQSPWALTITNTGTVPCTLDGYPTVSYLDAQGEVVPFTFRHGDQEVTSQPPQSVVVIPGHAAYVLTNKYRCDIRQVSFAAVMDLVPPGQTQALHLSSFAPYCGPGDPGSVIAVSPIEPNLQMAFSAG
jgi:hypothetical protein